MKGFVAFILIIAAVVGGVYFYMKYVNTNSGTNVPADAEWLTYTNDEYGFKIDYPSDWKVLDFSNNEIAPIFNIVKVSESKDGPFTHHDEVTQVSIFPNGYPTEGVIGETVTSTVEFSEETQFANDYVLENGTSWATFATFKNVPDPWQEAGFVWAEVEVGESSTVCTRNGEEVDENQCDPFSGDSIVRSGTVSQEDRDTELRILKSFEFTKKPTAENTNDLIRVTSPIENSVVGSPLIVRGEARGSWYFEASFPIVLVNWDGFIISETHAEAKGDWMTEDFVPFEAQVIFDKPEYGATGTLILKNDNPSGLPENDKAIEIPVRFE